jgi:hypothetical protein
MKLRAQVFAIIPVVVASSAFATPSSLCREGLCEVFSIATQGKASGDSSGPSSNGNIVIVDPGSSGDLVQLNCRVSAEVPAAAWAGVQAMFASVKGVDRPPADLNNAQQVMILFYSSIQDMLKEFSCDRAAAQWKS